MATLEANTANYKSMTEIVVDMFVTEPGDDVSGHADEIADYIKSAMKDLVSNGSQVLVRVNSELCPATAIGHKFSVRGASLEVQLNDSHEKMLIDPEHIMVIT